MEPIYPQLWVYAACLDDCSFIFRVWVARPGDLERLEGYASFHEGRNPGHIVHVFYPPPKE